MSRVIWQSALSGLLGSKRFIVSVCAAIAMVLGAMSVGASVFNQPNPNGRTDQPSKTPVFADQTAGTSNTPDTGLAVGTTPLASQGPLTLRKPARLTPPITTQLPATTSLGIQLGQAGVGIGLESVLGQLQVKASTTAVAPLDMSAQTSISTPVASLAVGATTSTNSSPASPDTTSASPATSAPTDTSATSSTNPQPSDPQADTQTTNPPSAPLDQQPPVAPQAGQ